MSFRHKGHEALYTDASKKSVQAAHVDKLLRFIQADVGLVDYQDYH